MLQIIKNIITNKLTLFSLLVMLVGGCAFAYQKNSLPYARFEERVGKDVIEVLIHPIHVAVSKVSKGGNKKIVIDFTEQELPPDQIEKLQKILLRDGGYHFDRKKKCLFIPDIAFRFDNNTEVRVMVSRSCRQIQVMTLEKAVILDYDPMAKELDAFCEEVKSHLNNKP